MRIESIQEVLRKQPFRPFALKTASGHEHRVVHPEFIALGPKNRIAIVTSPEGGYDVIDLALIESIVFPENDEKGAA